MRDQDADLWAGVILSVLCVAAGVPVLLLQLQGREVTAGPPWLWWVVFALFLATMVGCTWFEERLSRRTVLAVFGSQVALVPALVLIAAGTGWVPILLVLTASLSVYVVGRAQVTVAIVAVYTLTAGFGAWLADAAWLEVLLTAGLYLLLQLVSVAAGVVQQQETATRQQLAEAHTELRAAGALLAESSRSRERLRIARDLHDVVGHQLTALALELEVATHRATDPAAEHVVRARGIAKDLLTDVRATVSEMREPAPDLRAALEHVVADLPRPRVHLDVADGLATDDDSVTALIRCIQEIVTNAIRHADARNLWISVTAGADRQTVLHALDDGRGTRQLAHGNGLHGIRERIEELGGETHFSSPGGFEVIVEIPAP